MKQVIVAGLFLLAAVALYAAATRYEITSGGERGAYRLDRWTGAVVRVDAGWAHTVWERYPEGKRRYQDIPGIDPEPPREYEP